MPSAVVDFVRVVFYDLEREIRDIDSIPAFSLLLYRYLGKVLNVSVLL